MPHNIPVTLVFCTKVHGEIRMGSPLWGRQKQVGWVKFATFDEKRAITRKRYKIDA